MILREIFIILEKKLLFRNISNLKSQIYKSKVKSDTIDTYRNSKFKAPNPKQIQMTKIQNSKQNFKIKVLDFEHLNFEFV